MKEHYFKRYMHHLKASLASHHRIVTSRLHIGWFYDYAGKDPEYIKYMDIEEFLGSLYDKKYSEGYIKNVHKNIKAFFTYLVKINVLSLNPCIYVNSFSKTKYLPRDVPTDNEVKKIIDKIPSNKYRDRALIELLYGSGLRVSEAVGIRLGDIDFEKQLILIRESKSGLERTVPFNDITRYAVLEYMDKQREGIKNMRSGRNQYTDKKEKGDYLFLSPGGVKLSKERVNRIVRKYADLSGIEKHITAHSLRHACASEMVKNGAGIRWVQKLLGHRSINTTMIYTRLQTEDLKKEVEKVHPHGRERLCLKRR